MDLRLHQRRAGARTRSSPTSAPDGRPLVEVLPDGGDVHAGGHGDAGEKGVNYTNAPLHRRLGAAPGYFATVATAGDWSKVLSSQAHGDPATPIARSYAGDQLRVRVLGGNRPRQTGFELDGASWRQEPYDTESPLVGVQGGIGTGKAVNVHARLTSAGDHLWSNPTTYGLPDGMWGMARVYPTPADARGFVADRARQHRRPVHGGHRPAAAARADLRVGRRLRRHRRRRHPRRRREGDGRRRRCAC